jgi:hypothetical protein
MNIQEILPGNRKLIQQFLSLPKDIYRDIPQWVPPLTTDLAHIFDRRGNPFYRQSQAVFFLAQDTVGQPIGRLAVLDNVAYNQYNQEKTAFFFFLNVRMIRSSLQDCSRQDLPGQKSKDSTVFLAQKDSPPWMVWDC